MKNPFVALSLIMVVTIAFGVGCAPTTPSQQTAPVSAPTGTVSVSISSFVFQPQTVTVAAGTSVTWTNNDSTAHTVTADDDSFDSGSLGQGASFTHVFSSAGTVSYHCTFHPNMQGSVTVK